MAIDVSVVVPVYNPGPAMNHCVRSLLDQTLSPDRYEVILVDDGSTDGTGERLDALQRSQPDRVRVAHIPNSGWPSRPRNVGVGMASGRYVQFVDNDDALTRDALRRLLEVADGSRADVVIGKFASNFRGFRHSLFRETVTGRTLADFPLEDSLTPHKLFSRSFLDQHDIRFVEGIRNLEDQIFCMQVYVRTRSAAVVADTLCYHYQRRVGPGSNAGTRQLDPAAYYDCLELVFDIVDEHVHDDELRTRVYRRFYRNEMLGRLRDSSMLDFDPAYRQELSARVREVAVRRLPPTLHDRLHGMLRVQSRLFLDQDVTGLVDFSEQLVALNLQANVVELRWVEGRLRLAVAGRLILGDAPLRLEPSDDGWALPVDLAPDVEPADRRVRKPSADDVELELNSRLDGTSWPISASCAVRVSPTGTVDAEAEATIDLQSLQGGQPLSAGLWDFRLRVGFGELTRGSTITVRDSTEPAPTDPAAWVTADGVTVRPYRTQATGHLALDVGQWLHADSELLTTDASTTVTRGSFTLTAPLLRGEPGSRLPGRVSFAPPTADTHPVHLDAVMRMTPDHGRLSVRLPRRVRRQPGSWHVWVRLGEPGASAPVVLPLTIAVKSSGVPEIVMDKV
jgi:glycosyltransferase involved in cell wall biosynthesis